MSTAGSNTKSPYDRDKEWKTRSWSHFPKLVLLSLLGSIIAMGMSVVVLVVADDSPIASWPLTPTVYLSIITTLSNAMLRFAFSEGSGLHWWSRLLSSSGVRLSGLHTMWDISHSIFAIATFPTQQARQYLLRLTALLVILLAVNGPFLQRAVTVGFATRDQVYQALLPVRREPIWDLTAKAMGAGGYIYTSPPYQPEFTNVVSDLSLRQPMTLSQPACPRNATCSANVTVAGFTWSCAESEAPTFDIPSLAIALNIVFITNGRVEKCRSTGYATGNDTNDSSNHPGADYSCRYFHSEFQLSVDAMTSVPALVAADGEMAWQAKGLRPGMFSYTSYLRSDIDTDILAIRRCNFSTSFVNLPIKIVNERIVTLEPLGGPESSQRRSRHGVESIPAGWLGPSAMKDFPTIGFRQIMADMYAGYMIYDSHEGSHTSLGSSARQYINQSSIVQREWDSNLTSSQLGYKFSYHDPLDDFVTTLNEVSLRYALMNIDRSPERLEEIEVFVDSWLDPEDIREQARNLKATPFSEDQSVQLHEKLVVAVYKSHFGYTAVAVGVTYFTSLMILLLLRDVFSSHGRIFSMSPLEIAKAFRAPILANVGSNEEAGDIARASSGVRVKYGQATVDRQSDEDLQYDGSSSRGRASGFSESNSMLSAVGGQVKLRIDELDNVTKPFSGRIYL